MPDNQFCHIAALILASVACIKTVERVTALRFVNLAWLERRPVILIHKELARV